MAQGSIPPGKGKLLPVVDPEVEEGEEEEEVDDESAEDVVDEGSETPVAVIVAKLVVVDEAHP